MKKDKYSLKISRSFFGDTTLDCGMSYLFQTKQKSVQIK